MKRVIIESPYAGHVYRNMEYLRRCVVDSLSRGESPYASHAFFTQFLDDKVPEERKLGIEAGLAWASAAESVIVYLDYGISGGMKFGIDRHKAEGRAITFRHIGENE